MTTKAAAALYEAQHLYAMEGKGWAVYNPDGLPVMELPVIYGFNNGGSPGWYSAVLIAEDGTGMGGHVCSSPAYMLHDLGILEGTRPDRHEGFREHYPHGYRMEMVEGDIKQHVGLMEAYRLNQLQAEAAKNADESDPCADMHEREDLDREERAEAVDADAAHLDALRYEERRTL
jgi:hypothetical protein